MMWRRLISSLKCNNERHRTKRSSGLRAAREKLPAVPRPIAGMRSPVDALAFMLHNLTATQPKTYLGRASEAPVEAYIMKDLSAGATAYLTAVVRSRSGAASRPRVRRRGSPW